MTEVKLGKYRHFKGMEYEVIGVARDSETKEEFVVYRALYDHPEFGPNPLFIRSKLMFLETIERDGKIIPRFEYVGK